MEVARLGEQEEHARWDARDQHRPVLETEGYERKKSTCCTILQYCKTSADVL